MFKGALTFNQHLNDWSVNSVTTMEGMFQDASAFDQPLYKWDVSTTLQDASGMFYGASSFNQDISGWFPRGSNTISNMTNMFREASSFNEIVYTWDVSNVKNMDNMFNGANSFSTTLEPWGGLDDVSKSDISNNTSTTTGTGLGWWHGYRASNSNDFHEGIKYYFRESNANPVGDSSTGIVPEAIFYIKNWDVSNVDDMSNTFNKKSFGFRC